MAKEWRWRMKNDQRGKKEKIEMRERKERKE